MILITLRSENSRTIVGIAGKLDETHLVELREQCVAAGTRLVFDLSELRSADKSAIHWLAERHARGDDIHGASPYIKLLLERDKQGPDSSAPSGGRGNGEEGE